MKTFKSTIEVFFNDYEKTFQDSINGKKVDAKKVVAFYADTFVQANPKGTVAVRNDKDFLDAIPKSYEFYNQLGSISMKIAKEEITILDEWHAVVKIHWKSDYQKKDGKKVTIDYDVHYFVQQHHGSIKIFSSISGDEEKLIKESGLVV